MKNIIAATLFAFCAIGTVGSATAQPSVGVSIGINQPGVYGRIDIGDAPRPALVYAEPVLIMPPRVVVQQAPIYLYVPPTHQQNWRRYCGSYNACGQPVYFVRDQWVRERYEQDHPDWDRGRHKDWDKHDKYDKKEKKDKGDKHGGRGRGSDRDD